MEKDESLFQTQVKHEKISLGLGELKNLDNIIIAEGDGPKVYRKSVCLDAFNSWQLLSFI